MKPLKNCPKCKGKGRVQLPPTYPPRRTEYTFTDCECVSRVPKGLQADRIIGEAAALENLIATCESDIGNYRRDDRTERQNAAMWDALENLKTEFTSRRAALLAKL